MSKNIQTDDPFWSRVWQCAHRHPCKKCCWPWKQTQGLYCILDHASSFTDARLGKKPMPCIRVAYFLATGTLAFSSATFHFCHQCDYQACCNPAHVCMGSSYDNTEDARNRQLTTRQIRLPNGVILTKNHPWCAGPAQAPRSLVRGYRQTIESQQISPYQTIQVADNWYECPKVPLWLPYRLYLISKEVPLRHNRQSWVAPTPFNLWWLEDQDTLRKKHGLSQVALAEKLGVTEATVNRWERGHTNIPYERLKQVASLFKVRPADIVPDLDEIPPSLLNTTLDEVAHV